MQDFLVGLAFVLIIEGLIYGLFPGGARKMAFEVLKMPESNLRTAGVIAMAIGVGAVWLLRS